MEKLILVDGNNLLFRSYYATAYTGNIMTNSKNFPTNALYGFVNMINKIINEENPSYIIVAFDKGKTFRHKKYDFYKGGRSETPNELKLQFPKAKELLDCMGIKWYEIDNYEADDIIGTFARFCDLEENFIGTIISSDKDLLQLISSDIDIKLLKQKDYIRYNFDTFKEAYGFDPIHIIDLKALMGDPSDNIPGVKGIGEKTAIKLLQEYSTLDGIYDNLDKLTPKLREKLEVDKDNAYMSYEIATIIKDVPLEINISDTKYLGPNIDALNKIYEELEFRSLLKKQPKVKKHINQVVIDDPNFKLEKDASIYVEILGSNYHTSKVLGVSICDGDNSYFLDFDIFKKCFNNIKSHLKYTYDLKKLYVLCKKNDLELKEPFLDLMIVSSLLDYDVREDVAYLARTLDYDIEYYYKIYGKTKISEASYDVTKNECLKKAEFIFEEHDNLLKELESSGQMDVYEKIEKPLIFVLGDIEYNGINVDRDVLYKMKEEMSEKISLVTNEIYDLAGCEFNIASPYKLGDILFEKLGLPHGKKSQRGYSTSIEVLNKLKGKHEIINKIIEYRLLTKLYSTYVEGILSASENDSKVHTIYTQNLTRTGRLSSLEPNLQNIPIRNDDGRLIRKVFVPSPNSVILSSDYSQIELRIFSHMANVQALIDAFKNDLDIHASTASDIFGIPIDKVTSNERRVAKAVNFGIVYGISSFGLSENLDISMIEAKKFMDHYMEIYPGIKEYRDAITKEAYEKLVVETLFKRKRFVKELSSSVYAVRQQGERIALNTPVQGTSADIIKMAMIKIDKVFKEKNIKSKMIVQVHDELVFDVLKDELETVIQIVKDVMENICKLNVPLKVSIAYGENWYEAK